MPVRPEKKKQFERRVQRFLNLNSRVTDREAREMVRLLRQARNDIVNQLKQTPAHQWNAFYLPQLRRQIDARLVPLENQLLGRMFTAQDSFFEMSLDKADELMIASGIEPTAVFIDQSVIESTKVLTGELVITIPQDLQKRLGNVVSLGLSGQKSVTEVAEDIMREFKHYTFPQAERIARTELMRTQSIAQEKRYQQIYELDPTYLKRWIHSHKPNGRSGHAEAETRYTENPIPFNQPFMVAPKSGGKKEAGQFPRDPIFSAGNSINCGCIHTLIPPSEQEMATSVLIPAGAG